MKYHCPFTTKEYPRTRQEIVDAVVEHLERQGGPAADRDGCFYRTGDGKACAFGCLIPDTVYREHMENACSDAVFDMSPSLRRMYGEYQTLIEELQTIHDDYTPCVDESWSDTLYQMRDLA